MKKQTYDLEERLLEYQHGCKETEIGVESWVLKVSFSFDVGRSMLDVRRSSFKTSLHGTNVSCECLQNKLELMGPTGSPLFG